MAMNPAKVGDTDEAPQKRAKGGRISGAKSKGNPGKRARGGAESNPYSAAGSVSEPGYVSSKPGNNEGGKGADSAGEYGH
jgi:hypothetical protein